MTEDNAAIVEAQQLLDKFMRKHMSAAIPTLIGVCCLWAVEHGGADVMRGLLKHALGLVDELDGVRRSAAQ